MTDSTTPSSEKPSASQPAKKQKKRRTWKQRLKITAIVVIVAAILIRIALNFLLPTVVRKVANAYDLDCTYDRMSLGLFEGNAHIWNLELRPRGGGDSIIRADYIQGSISTTNLFRGRLVVYRAEVDGVDMIIEREPDGSIPLLDRLLSGPEDAPISVEPEPTRQADGDAAQPPSLQPPLRIDAVRLFHVNTVFRDRSVTPTFETTIRTSMRLSDVGADGSPARFELEITSDPLLDTLLVSGVMNARPDAIDADLELLIRGLHAKPAAPYLLPLGIRPIADDITIRGQAKLNAATIPDSTDVSATLTISDISVVADQEQWASLKAITLDAKRISGSAVELGQLLIETGRASARRSAEGYVQIAGFELVPAAPSSGDQTSSTRPSTDTAAASAASPSPLRISLDELRIADMQASFDDQAVAPAAQLVARLEHLSAKDIVIDPANPGGAVTIDGLATLPGVIETIRWNGTVSPFAQERRAAIALRAEGIRPDALEPYLKLAGLASELENGLFTARLDAVSTTSGDRATTTARIREIRFADGDATWLEMATAEVSGLSINPADGAIHVRAIEIAGPTINLQRDADGALHVFGLKTLPADESQPAAPTPAALEAPAADTPAKATPAAPAPLPRIQIDRFAWNDIRLGLEDRFGVNEPIVLQGQAGIEAANLVFDASAAQPAAEPGRFSAWLELPGVAERLQVDGTLQATAHGVAVASSFQGRAITGSTIAPYLRPLGIELTLTDGQLAGRASANVATADNTLKLDLDLSDIVYTDGQQELAGVRGVKISGVVVTPQGVAVNLVQIDNPRARVARNADGTIESAGVRLVPVPPTTQPVAASAGPSGPPQPLTLAPAPMELALKALRLNDAAIEIADRAVAPALQTVVRTSATLDDVTLRGDAPARLSVTTAIEGIVDELSLTGTLNLAPQSPSATLVLQANAIHGDALAPYLPPGTQNTLRDGRFTVTLDAAAANHAEGGISAHVIVRDLLLEERANNATLARVGAFTVRASRLDPPGGVLAIDRISSAGVELDITRQPNGAMDVLGLRIGGEAPQALAQPEPAEQAAAADHSAPAAIAVASATTQPSADVAAIVADARRALPLLTIDQIDLVVDRIAIHGLATPEGAPLAVSMRLHNPAPFELGGNDPASRPPLTLQLDGSAEPIVRQFAVTATAKLFENEPSLTIDVNTSGINGKGLTDVAPPLAEVLDGQGLTEGTFTTRLVADVNYGRRGPRDFDLSRGFTATFTVQPLEFRAQPDGPVLAGVEAVRGEGINVQPQTGKVIIRSIEVVKPIGRFVRDEQGLHVMGLVLPLGDSASAGQADATTEPADVVSADAGAADRASGSQPPTPAERPQAEIRLDRVAVSGIDVIIEDRTTDPTTIVPLKTLDLEVRDISNQMLWTGRPMRFDMLCTADRVPLPPRKGVTSTAPASADGLEDRELFSQIVARGQIGMKQLPDGRTILTGWAKTSVSGFELLGVRGLAKAQQVEIGGGVFDHSTDIRFRDNGLIETRNRAVFTNLSLSEPPNGPLQRIFQLPAPIDVAIGALTAPDGSITLNLPVTIESGEVDKGKLIAPLIGAVGQVLGTAIASAPIKAVGGVGEMLNIGGGPKAPEEPVELTFLPGVATLEPADLQRLAALVERVRRDSRLELQLRHEMSSADVAHAAQRANPPLEDVRVMADRLRRDKAQLLSDRAVLAARARAEFAAQSAEAAESVATLRAIDRRLAQIDRSLEQLGELLRPGAETQADRRTRAASLAVAEERFQLIEAALASADIRDLKERIHRTNAQFDPTDLPSGGRVVITVVRSRR